MTLRTIRSTIFCISLGLAAGGVQTFGQTAPKRVEADKATAYYHFSLGHLYSDLASSFSNRGEYLSKAIENYRLAMKADPDAAFLAEELSDLYVQSGRLREAVSEAEEAIKQNPSDANSRRMLGRIYTRMIGDTQQGKVNEEMLRKAIEQYQRLSEIDAKDVETLLTLGRLQNIAQNSPEAEKAYKKILEIDPNHEDALTGLAVVYDNLGDKKQSAELLARVVAKNPSLRTLTALAQQFQELRDFKSAAETLRKAVELSPANLGVKKAYAQSLLFAEETDEALKVFTQVVAEDPKDSEAFLRISEIYRQKRDFAKAREAAEKAIALSPDSVEAQYSRVNLLNAEGKSKEAIAALNEILASSAKRSYSAGEKSNRIRLLHQLSLMYRGNEQTEEAVQALRQIVELDPNSNGRVSAQVADTYRAAKEFNKAIEEANAGLKKNPDEPVLRAVRASVLAEVGKTNEAVADLKSLLNGKDDRETYISLAQVYEKAKNYDEMAKAIDAADKLSDSKEEKESILFMRGAMLEKQKKYDAAEAEFKRVIEMNPKNASALNYLGYMLADRSVRVPEALELIKQALEIDPNNGAYLDSLGWAYFRAGDLAQAERYLLQAVEKYSKDPTVHDHLGDVYFKRGKVKEAVEEWQKSLQEWQQSAPADVDPAEVAKVQKKLDSAKVRLAQESGGVRTPKQQ